MVRVKLTQYNNTALEAPLNFSQMGDLTQPINASRVSVVKFSIPNALNPIMNWDDTRYTISLECNGENVIQPVLWEDRGSTGAWNKPIYEYDHLVTMINDCFSDAVTALALKTTLPDSTPPRLIYNVDYSRFELVVPYAGYQEGIANQITIFFNTPMFYVLSSLPTVENPNDPDDFRFQCIFNRIPENTYMTNYIKVYQESISLTNYAVVRNILITTNLPVESMTLCSNTSSSNQIPLNVIQSYTIPYRNGIIDSQENLDFNAPVNEYRSCELNGFNLYSIKVNVVMETNIGETKQFYLPPYSSAIIELEFN